LFDSLLNLESSFYDQGLVEGLADGERSGLNEGMQFGLQTGFNRFLSVGIIQGRCRIWNQTAPAIVDMRSTVTQDQLERSKIVPLGSSTRVFKQLEQLDELVTNMSTENSEEAIEHFEKSLSRAKKLATIVGRRLKDPIAVTYEDEVVQVASGQIREEIIEDI
ncbi:uncharacterized protein V1516DRAFT_605861, partial [Lipomyces oligophaga]|uniref:uncharacterized protein n=1 Tax=Lipomyces oligophaga TaxID=45792 RepID=UPI0034CE281A